MGLHDQYQEAQQMLVSLESYFWLTTAIFGYNQAFFLLLASSGHWQEIIDYVKTWSWGIFFHCSAPKVEIVPKGGKRIINLCKRQTIQVVKVIWYNDKQSEEWVFTISL